MNIRYPIYEGVYRILTLYQDSGPSDRKKRGFLKPYFCFLEVCVQIAGTDARFSG